MIDTSKLTQADLRRPIIYYNANDKPLRGVLVAYSTTTLFVEEAVPAWKNKKGKRLEVLPKQARFDD